MRRPLVAMRAALIVSIFCTIAPALAAPPVIDFVYPAGGQQGASFSLAVGAKTDQKIDPWPARLWTDCAGIKAEPEQTNGNFKVHIAKDAPLGPHLLRVYNDDGVSAPKIFIVDRHPEVLEQEPNDDPRQPQVIESLPAVVNGRLDKPGDVDCYSVPVKAGQWLVAELTCHRLGAPVDPALHVYDPEGIEVGFNHDTFGLDPLIGCRAPRSGRYVVQVIGFDYPPSTEVRFAGSKADVYRLLLTTGPYARYAVPSAVQRGIKQRLEFSGWNLGSLGTQVSIEFDASGLSFRLQKTMLAGAQIDNMLPIELTEAPQQSLTSEPENGERSSGVRVPVCITAALHRPGQRDRYIISASKGEQLDIALTPAAKGLPVDPILSIEDSSGNALARIEDVTAGSGAALAWTAPADGSFTAVVSDRNHQGGADFVYRLELTRPVADFGGAVDRNSVRIDAGKSVDLRISVVRRGGLSTPLAPVVSGLPDGVTVETSGASGSDSFVLKLSATPNAPRANQPIRIVLASVDPDHAAVHPVTFDLSSEQLIGKSDALWLTVIPSPPAAQPTTQPTTVPN